MKFTAANVDRFIQQPDSAVTAALLYGPDLGLASERAEALLAHIVDDPKDPFRVVELTPERVKDDPAILTDELLAMSLVGGRRLVRLRMADNNCTAAIKDALAASAGKEAAFLLVTAGELAPRASLRQLFEKESATAALPCYHDDTAGLARVVQQALATAGATAEPDAITWIAEHCQGDRGIVRQELEKLLLYCGTRPITLEDARATVGETTESTLRDICIAVATGDHQAVEKHSRKALQQGATPVGVLRALLYYFLQLYDAAGQCAAGTPQEAAITALKPPIFFKEKPAFARALTRWSRQAEALPAALDLLYEAEFACKQTGANAPLLCQRYTMQLTALPANLARAAA